MKNYRGYHAFQRLRESDSLTTCPQMPHRRYALLCTYSRFSAGDKSHRTHPSLWKTRRWQTGNPLLLIQICALDSYSPCLPLQTTSKWGRGNRLPQHTTRSSRVSPDSASPRNPHPLPLDTNLYSTGLGRSRSATSKKRYSNGAGILRICMLIVFPLQLPLNDLLFVLPKMTTFSDSR